MPTMVSLQTRSRVLPETARRHVLVPTTTNDKQLRIYYYRKAEYEIKICLHTSFRTIFCSKAATHFRLSSIVIVLLATPSVLSSSRPLNSAPNSPATPPMRVVNESQMNGNSCSNGRGVAATGAVFVAIAEPATTAAAVNSSSNSTRFVLQFGSTYTPLLRCGSCSLFSGDDA